MNIDTILDFSRNYAIESDETNIPEANINDVKNFDLAPIAAPHTFLSTTFKAPNAPEAIKMAKGTTTLAFVFKHGVLVTVDSRSTQGPYIASQSVKKIIEITPYLVGTMAGGAADCQFWERELGRRCRLYELQNKKRITVAAASKTLSNITYAYRRYGLSMGTMIAGFDHTGPSLYYVDNDGTRLKGNRFAVGSGSTYAYGVLDTGYDYNLSIEDAAELGRRAVHQATHRDAYSGGTINVLLVEAHGWRWISHEDTNDLYWEKYNAH